jgi:phytoene synthase
MDAWREGKSHSIIEVLKNIPKENWPNQKLVEIFLNGQMSDIKFTSFKSDKALIIYCYQVAGTVGLMVCDIFGVKDKKMRYFAIDLGIAMQLVNISRDIYEDSLRNRIYLPESLIGKYTPNEIAKPTKKTSAKIDLAREKIIHLANIYFASASQAIDHLPKGAALAVKLASALYQQIGFQLIHTRYQHNERRCYVTSFSKLLITLNIIAKFLITFKANLKPHNKNLHKFLLTLPDSHF